MLLSVVENIWDFIYRTTSSGLTTDLIFYIGIGFITLMVLFFIIKSHYAYEGRLERSLEKINRWLFVHQQIDESNLVEFNNLIKKAPKLLRYHWQQYMLYREQAPSHYLSMYNCIEKPLHTSTYAANIKNYMNICLATMLATFVIGFIGFGNSQLTVAAFTTPLITPLIILVLSVIFLMVLRTMQNFNLSSLYQNFSLFNRYLDKASATIPQYVDFEILFTRKEIKGGIPVLNEYLEKRARQEAEELERARQNAVDHEEYDFSSLGIDSSLVLDRAMKESEIYLNARQRILTQIQQLESEMDSIKRNYENTSKDCQRKLQASKENIERLRQQQEETTNRIEVNYIRKQQQDEIKKQEQLEKDQDDATRRYTQESGNLTEQIDKLRTELEEKKAYVQAAMLAEYQTFSDKVYKGIRDDIGQKHQDELHELSEIKDGQIAELTEKSNEELRALNEEKLDAIRELEQAKQINDIKDSVIDDLRDLIKERLQEREQEEQAFVQAQAQAQAEREAREQMEEELRLAREQAEAERLAREQAEAERLALEQAEAERLAAEQQVEEVQEVAPVEEVVEQQPVEEAVEEQPVEQTTEEQPEGFYDENGYYWYPNGAYYDNLGYYHDEFGGVYDPEGNYTPPQEAPAEEAVEEVAPVEEVVEEQQPATDELDDLIGDLEQAFVQAPVEETPAQEEVAEETPAEEEQPLPREVVFKNIIDDLFGFADEQPQQEVAEETPVEEATEDAPVVEETPIEEVAPVEEAVEVPAEQTPVEQPTEVAPVVEQTPVEEKPAEEVAQQPAKKRGRPRKTEEPAKKPAGKRGRPRKTEEPAKKTAGKRGRPRKTEEKTAEVEPAKRRGRPKGSTTANKLAKATKKPAAKKATTAKKTASKKTAAPKATTAKKTATKKPTT